LTEAAKTAVALEYQFHIKERKSFSFFLKREEMGYYRRH